MLKESVTINQGILNLGSLKIMEEDLPFSIIPFPKTVVPPDSACPVTPTGLTKH